MAHLDMISCARCPRCCLGQPSQSVPKQRTHAYNSTRQGPFGPSHGSGKIAHRNHFMSMDLRNRQGGHVRDSRICTNAFLGVGAPEAVLVGVVALVLFGPKGLAQAAKSLGQAVKAIAPTLRELTDISTDLKSTIEDEIGLSEIRDELQSTLSPTPRPKPVRELRSFEENVSDDPDIDEKRKESAKLAWGSAVEDSSSEVPSQKSVDSMSLEDLEKEILRRRAAESNETQS